MVEWPFNPVIGGDNGQPVKFPSPAAPGPYHVIVVDMRGFLGGNGGDNGDYIQLTYGNAHVNDEFVRRYWIDPATGQRGPILGLFENTNRPRGAPTLRERIHGILFARDTRPTSMTALCRHPPRLQPAPGDQPARSG